MTKEQTAECIKVMQAYVDGKQIEYSAGGKFEPINDPNWNWWENDYRIKQIEPKQGQRYTRKNSKGHLFEYIGINSFGLHVFGIITQGVIDEYCDYSYTFLDGFEEVKE